MQRRVGVLAERLVGLYHLGDVAGLEGDLEVEEPHLFGDLDLVQGAGDERLGLGQVQESLLDRAGVDPDPHGDACFLALLDHCPEAVIAADVARVDAHAGGPGVRSPERHAVVEVDVRYQGHGRAPDDFFEAFEGLGAVDRDAHEVGASGV
jgi:hypothetical protein